MICTANCLTPGGEYHKESHFRLSSSQIETCDFSNNFSTPHSDSDFSLAHSRNNLGPACSPNKAQPTATATSPQLAAAATSARTTATTTSALPRAMATQVPLAPAIAFWARFPHTSRSLKMIHSSSCGVPISSCSLRHDLECRQRPRI